MGNAEGLSLSWCKFASRLRRRQIARHVHFIASLQMLRECSWLKSPPMTQLVTPAFRMRQFDSGTYVHVFIEWTSFLSFSLVSALAGDDQSPFGVEGDYEAWLSRALWPALEASRAASASASPAPQPAPPAGAWKARIFPVAAHLCA